MAIREENKKVQDNMNYKSDKDKMQEEKLNMKVAARPGRKRLLQIYNDSEIERELGPGSGYSTDELYEILFKLHGNMINK